MKLKNKEIEIEQSQSDEDYVQFASNQLNSNQNLNEKTENKQLKNNKGQKLNNKWNKIASRLKRNWLLKFEFLFIILLLVGSIYLLDVFGVKIYQVISKGTTGENNVHLELAIIINKNHEQYIYAKSLKDSFFLLKSGLFNVLSMTTDVFYATLKTSLNETSIFVGNLHLLTKLLRVYQILVATIFIVVPFLFFLFFVHILKTLFRKIAIISKILVANNIGQLSNDETDNLKQKKVRVKEKPVKIKPVKKVRIPASSPLAQNLDLPNQQNVLTQFNKKTPDKMDYLKNKKNDDTINSDRKKEKVQYSIGSIIHIDNVAYDIIKFQKRVENGKSVKVVLARNTKTGEIINFPYDQ